MTKAKRKVCDPLDVLFDHREVAQFRVNCLRPFTIEVYLLPEERQNTFVGKPGCECQVVYRATERGIRKAIENGGKAGANCVCSCYGSVVSE